MTYRSKVDIGLAMGVGVGLALGWGAAFIAISRGIVYGWPLLLVVVGVVTVVFPVRYRITETELIVRSGVLRKRILLDSIEEVHPTRNALSAAAWSLDRLQVNYRDKQGSIRFLLISPERKKAFLRELADRVPELEFDEDYVKRKAGGGYLGL